MFTGIIFLVFIASVAWLWREGLWSNAITLINLVTAALLATSYWEPIADWLDGQMPTYTYLLDWIALWAVFCVAFVVMRAITDQVSKVRVRFKKPVEMAGGMLMAVWVGWVMVCFTTMSLHMAPLSREFLSGALKPDPEEAIFLGFSPDRQWLGFVHKVTGESGTFASFSSGKASQFDPRAEFVYRYAQRRANFEQLEDMRTRR